MMDDDSHRYEGFARRRGDADTGAPPPEGVNPTPPAEPQGNAGERGRFHAFFWGWVVPLVVLGAIGGAVVWFWLRSPGVAAGGGH